MSKLKDIIAFTVVGAAALALLAIFLGAIIEGGARQIFAFLLFVTTTPLMIWSLHRVFERLDRPNKPKIEIEQEQK